MNAQEKKILQKIVDNLLSSKKTNWETGDINDWHDHANNMKTSIKMAAGVIQGLIEVDPPNEAKETEEDLISKNLQ